MQLCSSGWVVECVPLFTEIRTVPSTAENKTQGEARFWLLVTVSTHHIS